MEVPIVKLVIKDLINGDAAKEELIVLDTILHHKDIQLNVKDTIILNLNSQIANFNFYDHVQIKNRTYRVNLIEYKAGELSKVEFILIG